ncbi:hypothetical protein [Desulforamulus ferrireducens]|uniref:Uncharacterized protein n=1 Tax=Desulforamulus ferrireducens TaxID=1833852 RepID=A0A1S6IXW3_9FIRM|nr:hypothetical protein [Desulforamulus ferrireducens]AQS59614.1 hypothetical protein B0537_11320 [Desulforamulus ferrireducens]
MNGAGRGLDPKGLPQSKSAGPAERTVAERNAANGRRPQTPEHGIHQQRGAVVKHSNTPDIPRC